jgi:NAD(P)-dependent dehydrogenase (short-subunit alcohol dehydrogenase family)
VVDIDGAAAEQVAQRIVELGGRAVGVQADVSLSADCRRTVEQVHRVLGSVTVLFNNAGIVRRTSILDISEEEWDRVMAVNVKSVF